MERLVDVYLAIDGGVRVGRLWRARSGRESASFEYDDAWLARPDAFSLDPELVLGAGQFHTDRPLFNAFTDPAPDRWGQTLLRRNERVRARAEGRAARTLLSIDMLVLVDDEARLGALQFRAPAGGECLTTGPSRVPPFVEFPRLLRATSRVLDEEETDDDLALLLAPGTSLGGARPKASVRDPGGRLASASSSAARLGERGRSPRSSSHMLCRGIFVSLNLRNLPASGRERSIRAKIVVFLNPPRSCSHGVRPSRPGCKLLPDN